MDKDHPLRNIIGNPSRPVSTRKQLASDALCTSPTLCYCYPLSSGSYKVKLDESSDVHEKQKAKAPLVAKGYRQRRNQTAFQNGDLSRRVFVSQPEELKTKIYSKCTFIRLKRLLWAKQAPHAWYDTLHQHMQMRIMREGQEFTKKVSREELIFMDIDRLAGHQKAKKPDLHNNRAEIIAMFWMTVLKSFG
ncbi:hypothetical protein Tco_0891582 [Tanacetum coccineum]|uniref:Reverse transcriptase n=1 Tax=Tanacetum coccineum TaxID=301880 RepID=A0ABQ5C3D0_9ASTR